LNETDRIKAALPVYEVKSWIFGNRLVSIPFATICDPLVSSRTEFEFLLAAARNLSRELNSRYIEVRALNSTALLGHSPGKSFFKCHYLNLDTDLKAIEKNFHHSLRQKLRKVGRSGLKLKTGRSETDLQEFNRLNLMTRKRLGLPPQPCKFFKMLWDIFYPDKVRLLLAEHQEKAIAGVLLYIFKDRVSAEFTVTDWNYMRMNPVHFLYWEIIKWAHASGYKIFDLGRTDVGNIGLMNFKNSWGMEMTDITRYFYPDKRMDPIKGSFIHKIVAGVFRNAPDFAAKILGDICYAHLG
jgi:hypothetical protein